MPTNRPNIKQFTATTTVKLILDTNPKRKAVLIINRGSQIAELLSNQADVYGSGIPIDPNGFYESDHFNPQGKYYVATATGTTDLRIEEVIQDA